MVIVVYAAYAYAYAHYAKCPTIMQSFHGLTSHYVWFLLDFSLHHYLKIAQKKKYMDEVNF